MNRTSLRNILAVAVVSIAGLGSLAGSASATGYGYYNNGYSNHGYTRSYSYSYRSYVPVYRYRRYVPVYSYRTYAPVYGYHGSYGYRHNGTYQLCHKTIKRIKVWSDYTGTYVYTLKNVKTCTNLN